MDVITDTVSVEPPVRRRRRWPLLVAVSAVVALAVAGAVVVLPDDGQRTARLGGYAPPQPDLHMFVDPLPDGWVAHSAADLYPGEFSWWWMLDGSYQTSMYGTADDPSAPTVLLVVGDRLNQDGIQGSGTAMIDMTEWAVDGSTGTCASSVTGVRRCIVHVGDTVVQSHSVGLSPTELRDLLQTMQVRDGIPELAPAALPDGMVHLGSWRDRMPSPVGETVDGAAISSVRFNGPNDGLAILTVGHADEHDLAAAFEAAPTAVVTLDGVTYYHGTSESGLLDFVWWEAAGRAHALTVAVGRGIDPLALAASVRPAGADEWAAATTATPPQFPPGSSAPTTSLPPQPTLAPEPASVRDEPVAVTVSELPDGGGIEVRSTPPDAAALTLLVSPDGIAAGLDGQFEMSAFADGIPEVIMVARSTSSWGAFVITGEPRAHVLRVTRANGDRYVAPLVPFPGRDGLRVAAVVVPVDEFVGADLVDEFGARLDAVGLPAD